MGQAKGLWTAAGVILIASLGTQWVRSGYSHEVRPPSKDIRTLPERLGAWESVEERTLERRTADVLGADAFVGRLYRRPDGDAVSAQVAVWSDHSDGPTGVHYPEVCYANAGWTIVRTDAGVIRLPGGKQRPLRLMQIEGPNGRIVTAHWYQMGDATFFSKGEARAIHRDLWGERDWPCVVKVLLQVSAEDLESARPRLEEFAAAVGAWADPLR